MYDLKKLSQLIKPLKFFKALKLKERELFDICMFLERQETPRDTNIISYGDYGDVFYLMLRGSVSVWTPVANSRIILPLQAF